MYSAIVSKRDADASSKAGTLAAYLRHLSRLPRLSVDEERELGLRIRGNRDEAAVSQLVEANLRFVASYAKRYRDCGVSLLDLIHEGNLGLIEAARRFDPAHDSQFIGYAAWWVRQSMIQLIAERTRAAFPPKVLATPAEPIGPLDADLRAEALARDEVAFDGEPAPHDAKGDRLQRMHERIRHVESRAAGHSRSADKLHSQLN
jgi:RNA polymerase primary sigma factor